MGGMQVSGGPLEPGARVTSTTLIALSQSAPPISTHNGSPAEAGLHSPAVGLLHHWQVLAPLAGHNRPSAQ